MSNHEKVKIIPSDKIEIIPHTSETEQLIRYALHTSRTGAGTAGDLAKLFTSRALATDLDIYIERVRHRNQKILMTLSEYNNSVQIIKRCQRNGQIDYELAEVTIHHLRDAYQSTLRESSHFPTGLLCFGILFAGAVGLFGWKSFAGNQTPSLTGNNPSPTTITLPLAECGGSNVPSNQLWYPVWIDKVDEMTLNYIRERYCSKSFLLQVDPSKQVIQVASFHEYAKAESLAKMLENDPKVGNGKVGIVTRTIPKSNQ